MTDPQAEAPGAPRAGAHAVMAAPAGDPPWRAPPDERWWPAVAARILELAGLPRSGAADATVRTADHLTDAGGVPQGPCDLRHVVVLLPSMAHAADLRAALHAALQAAPAAAPRAQTPAASRSASQALSSATRGPPRGARACLAPRMFTLETWTGIDRQQELGRVAELYEALRASDWVRQRYGEQAGALWALARDVAVLGDELTLAACGEFEAFAGRWTGAVQRHFARRSAQAADPQAQLVLALWRAGLDGATGAAALRLRLDALARSATGPLLWLAPQGALPWQENFCRAYRLRSGHAARLLLGDFDALAAAHAWIGAAWPELAAARQPGDAVLSSTAGGAPPPAEAIGEPLAWRARLFAARLPGPAADAAPPLRVYRCASLEDEAMTAAQWTLDRLHDGACAIALVALDRLTARRVRALLDRAAVLVADEAGWKLSTTSAAAAVMRWLDLVAGDFAAGDLLDWLHSPFTLCDQADKTQVLGVIRAALVDDAIASGRQALLGALERRARTADPLARAALQRVEDLAALAQAWRRPGSLGRCMGLLGASLDRLGMRPALRADPVGRAVLQAIDELHDAGVGSALPLTLEEFRALLAGHFEQIATAHEGVGGAGIDSPVRMMTLAGTRLRRFDAALLIGADAEHLPGRRPAGGLLAPAVRRELGLRTEHDHAREQAQDVAGLVALVPRVDATWRCRRHDEPRALAPQLDRLALLAELAGAQPVVRPAPQPALAVAPAVSADRAPCAPELLPRRISASAYQDLVDCPYRYFARRMLGLRERRQPDAAPDKRELGDLLHAALDRFHREAPADEAAPVAQQRLRRIIEAVCAPRLAQQPALLGYRQRLLAMVVGYLAWQAATQQAGWRWADGERTLQRPLDEGALGGTVALHGRIDRIDEQGPGRFRVLDYKTRDGASLRRAQRDPGEDVQLLFYALLFDPPPVEAAYLSLQRPPDPRDPLQGVVQMVAAPQPLAAQAAALRGALALALERVAGGAALPANGVESVCRRCELRSLCRHGYTEAPPAPRPAGAAA